jgi:hypothetical protein
MEPAGVMKEKTSLLTIKTGRSGSKIPQYVPEIKLYQPIITIYTHFSLRSKEIVFYNYYASSIPSPSFL